MTISTGWRTTWTKIIPGVLGRSPTDLLFYDQSAGEAELYLTDGQGNLALLQSYRGWRTSWTQIIPGHWLQPDSSQLFFLLFYDRDAGEGEFYLVDNHGNLTLLQSYTGWRSSWAQIIPGRFGELDETQLLFYDSEAGEAELYTPDVAGNISLRQHYSGWRTSWAAIVPGAFGGSGCTDLLFYDRDAEEGEFYSVDCDGNLALMEHYSGWRSWTQIVSGTFGGPEYVGPGNLLTDLLFYNRDAGKAEFSLSEGRGKLNLLSTFSDWRTTWVQIIPGKFGPPGSTGYTDLLLYDSTAGEGEFLLYDTDFSWPLKSVEAYASATSVSPGEVITFHVYSQQESLTIDVFQEGLQEKHVYQDYMLALPVDDPIPADIVETGCGWPVAYSLTVPDNWESGVYIARLRPHHSRTAMAMANVPFVVKSATPGMSTRILVQCSVTTYQAYNWWGGRSLYGQWKQGQITWEFGWQDHLCTAETPCVRAFKVSFDRPYSSLHDLYYWELPFIQWLDQQGIDVDFCTSVDLHADPSLLSHYQLFVSLGHDEYWSKEMRDQVETFVSSGGNAAFFSGNTCWWQVRFEDNNRVMVCYKDAVQDPMGPADQRVTTNWFVVPGNTPGTTRPENTMTGVSYRNGGAWSDPCRPTIPYVVCYADHWAFESTNVVNGAQFGEGDNGDNNVVGYEVDAALFSLSGQVTGLDGTPLDAVILAKADLTDLNLAGRWATMLVYEANGTVFTAATINWSRGLSLDGGWRVIDQITKNILNRLSSPPVAP